MRFHNHCVPNKMYQASSPVHGLTGLTLCSRVKLRIRKKVYYACNKRIKFLKFLSISRGIPIIPLCGRHVEISTVLIKRRRCRVRRTSTGGTHVCAARELKRHRRARSFLCVLDLLTLLAGRGRVSLLNNDLIACGFSKGCTLSRNVCYLFR